ncbi:hypothetical protein M427DRAFT_275336 [Gonapodya prolifera JEL478]|uniref:Uncharacterized protein n=1 Tax=Gonapodya prolifera (strain JEL478) TaxID=1344416 RepID=A0A139AY56_GONPJ|nr:hypothetical protein M427DRAFT_275336 [Gonapodya prolifera JEL478]|eukprot:KXS21634.1 hypothetical protein M427DRAFT_275336 [Gonapodya prolifera JEL478]
MFYIAAWIGLTVFISVAYYRLKYHTRTQLQRLQREEELELTRRTATATAVAVDPSSKSVAIEGSHYGWLRLRTESPISERHAAMTTMARKVVFESASRALVRAPFALFIPSAMLMLARTAYAPTVVSTVELGGQQWAERVWYPVIK